MEEHSVHCININTSSRIFKKFAFELATPAATILNVSLSSGFMPVSWKESHIIPIPKITKPMSESDTTVNDDLGRAMSPNFGRWKYVDDLLLSENSLSSSKSMLDHINSWTSGNWMRLNSKKCK